MLCDVHIAVCIYKMNTNDCMQIVASDKLAPGAYLQGTSYPEQPREGLSKGLATL